MRKRKVLQPEVRMTSASLIRKSARTPTLADDAVLFEPERNDYTCGLLHPTRRTVGMNSMTRLQLLGLTAATALFATASAHAAGDKAAGRKLIYTCAGCHGVPGYSNAYPQYPVPKIAGQNEQYIVNALHGYQSGERTHPTMGAQAQSLSDTDIQNVAAYLSSLAK
jgi:cytochrome c553